MGLTIRRILNALGSRRLAAATLAAWCLLIVIWVVPFQIYGLPREQIKAIVYEEPFFRIVYVLLAVNSLACIVPRLAGALRRSTYAPTPSAVPHISDAERVEGPWDAARAEASLHAAGFSQTVKGEGYAWGVRRRWSPLGTALFHLGLFVLVAAALIALDPSATFRGSAVLVEGESFTGVAEDYTEIATPKAPLPAIAFAVETIHPQFYRDILLFTRLDAVLRDSDRRTHRMSLASPWILSPATYVAIEDFGYAPVVTSVPASKDTSYGPDVYKLSAFPSGVEDSFDYLDVGPHDYRIRVKVYGDYTEVDGKPASRSFNLIDPRLQVTVERLLSNGQTRPIVVNRIVALGEPIEVLGDEITIKEIRYYGVFRIVRSVSAPVLALGLLIVAFGAVLRLLLPRQEALIAESGEGVGIVVRDDTYRSAAGVRRRVAREWDGRA